MSDNTRELSMIKETNTSVEFQVKELKDYVDHFGDNLYLSSSQINVEVSTGFATKPISLSEVLKQCNSTFAEQEVQNTGTDEHISNIQKDLATKAPDSVLFNIGTLERKVKTIEIHLQKEEEQGIGVRFKLHDLFI